MTAQVETVKTREKSLIFPARPPAWLLDTDTEALDITCPRPSLVRAARDQEIFAQDEPALYCYVLVSGCVRTARLMTDGRRQIGEFLLPGDVFGWEAVRHHDFAAEAVTPCTLHRFHLDSLDALISRDGGFARQLRQQAARQVRAGRDHMLLLGRKNATERVISFLLDMADRLKSDEKTRVELPMGRSDMADYLGLTAETVCRHLTLLRRRGTILMYRTKVVIHDRALLEQASREPHEP